MVLKHFRVVHWKLPIVASEQSLPNMGLPTGGTAVGAGGNIPSFKALLFPCAIHCGSPQLPSEEMNSTSCVTYQLLSKGAYCLGRLQALSTTGGVRPSGHLQG